MNETFQQFEKQDSFRYILKSSASMYESSDLEFFRTTTRIQFGPDAFDESSFAMTFLDQFQISSRRENGKEIPESSRLRVYRDILSNQFCFIRCRRQHLQTVE